MYFDAAGGASKSAFSPGFKVTRTIFRQCILGFICTFLSNVAVRGAAPQLDLNVISWVDIFYNCMNSK